ADLAMQVVMPELDGRLLTGAISFKHREPEVPGLDFARTVHRPDPAGIALAADRAAGWARLAAARRGERRLAVVLSGYPNAGGQLGHTLGLDTFASATAILRLLAENGYETGVARMERQRNPGGPVRSVNSALSPRCKSSDPERPGEVPDFADAPSG